jgi:hypothetical protein
MSAKKMHFYYRGLKIFMIELKIFWRLLMKAKKNAFSLYRNENFYYKTKVA